MIALVVWSKIEGSTNKSGEIRVISKTPLGKEGSLAVIWLAGRWCRAKDAGRIIRNGAPLLGFWMQNGIKRPRLPHRQ